jgi:DNA-directed RNA polymerase subunit F
MRTRKGKLDQDQFNLIQTMLKARMKRSVIAATTGWSKNTISKVSQVDTWEEYKKLNHEQAMLYKTGLKPVVQTELVDISSEADQDLKALLAAIDLKIDQTNNALDDALEILQKINGKKRLW